MEAMVEYLESVLNSSSLGKMIYLLWIAAVISSLYAELSNYFYIVTKLLKKCDHFENYFLNLLQRSIIMPKEKA